MHIPWEEIQLVLAIAETRSLSGAARALRITQPTVSRRLAALERTLGERLFTRAVDGTTPTAFGERVLEPARRMAAHAADVERAGAGVDRDPRGVVRISAAPGMAYTFLAPFAGLVRTRLPAVTLEVVSTVRYVDLVRHEADLALRWQTTARRERPRDLELLARVSHPIAVFASPRYRASLPRDYRLTDIAWIAWSPPLDQLPPNPQLAARVPGFQPGFAADDFVIQLRAAEAGAGAIVLPRLRHRLEPAPTLVELDVDLRVPPAVTQLVAARTALAVPRVAAVAALLARELTATAPASRR